MKLVAAVADFGQVEQLNALKPTIVSHLWLVFEEEFPKEFMDWFR